MVPCWNHINVKLKSTCKCYTNVSLQMLSSYRQGSTEFICSQWCCLYTTSSSIIWTPLKHKCYYGSVFLVPILWRLDCVKYRGYTFHFSFDHFKDGVLTPCKVIWILEFRNFCFWSVQSGKVLPVESGNMAFGIHNSTQGTLKPTNNGIWNSSATDRESRIQNPAPGIWNSESNPVFDYLTYVQGDSPVNSS